MKCLKNCGFSASSVFTAQNSRRSRADVTQNSDPGMHGYDTIEPYVWKEKHMLQIRNIRKKYQTGDLVQQALDGVSLNLRDCEFVAILGPSGSGKTTLLNVIGGLDRYDSGELIINGLTTKKYRDADWDYYRNHTIGFVFQSYNLIPHQTLLANVELALTISGVSGAERRARALKALDEVGLKEQAHKKPNQLSGGQMQRVAIARALVNNPDIVLADEPTGALDSETSVQVMNLLREVAKSRLVVMVTHNPELARQYATRTVTIRDGKLIQDTDPYVLKKEEEQEGIVRRTGRSSMSFRTALSLSFNNLLTKKARTLLVSAAGSIGIIGIALIMSLSSGANAYIASIEKEAMAEYPLQITSVGYNLASIMLNVSSDIQANAAGSSDGSVGVVDTISSMFSGMSDNDLKSLKQYLESGSSDIDDYARSIRYIYGVTPVIYQVEENGYTKVNPSGFSFSTSSSSSSSSMMMAGTSGSFYELPTDSSLYAGQYDVRAGRWPQNSRECVLVLTDGGMVTDTLLYTLGFRDRAEMKSMMEALQSGKNVDIREDDSVYTYDSFLGIRFRAVSAASFYRYDEANNVYTSFENDTAQRDALLDSRDDLTIVGVVQPSADADTAILTTGIYYDAALTEEIMQEAADSSAVKAQLADPDVNIFTGKAFSDENAADSFSMENLFQVDTDALAAAFSYNPSALSTDTSALQPDFSAIRTDGLIDLSALAAAMPSVSEQDIAEIISAAKISITEEQLTDLFHTLAEGYDASTLTAYADGMQAYLKTDEAKAILEDFISRIMEQEAADVLQPDSLAGMMEDVMAGYPAFAAGQEDPSDFSTNLKAYLAQEDTSALLGTHSQELLQAIADLDISEEDLTGLMTSLSDGYAAYAAENGLPTTEDLTDSFSAYLGSSEVQQIIRDAVAGMIDTDGLSEAFTRVLQSSMSSFTSALSAQISSGMQNIMQQVAVQLQNAMVRMMSSMTADLGSMFRIDADAFASAIKVSMSASDLQSLLSSLMNNSTSSYASNLESLGYADPDSPEEIDIYPVDFDAKQEITSILDTYNQSMRDSGQDDKVIIYTDLVAAMMSSVTTIVDTISYVLIAFVAISLIVSSIMIGVITYISVLERRKEIGILRALGASKHNVAQVFNAETFITGLLAGSIGVITACLILIPANAVIHAIAGNSDINAYLPVPAAAGLIVLSVILTIIAGLLPSRKAAESDPVTALRTE